MSEVTTIGLDIAKSVFHAHGAGERGETLFSRKLTRGKLLDFFAGQPRCTVALEACGGAHHWARELQAMGHHVRSASSAYDESRLLLRQHPAGSAAGSQR